MVEIISTLIAFCCSAIEDRLNAVTELCADPSCMTPLKSLLSQLPDLERGLCTVYHRKVGLSMPNCISSNNKQQKQQHEFDALRAYVLKSFQILGVSTLKIFRKYAFLFYHKDDYCDGELYPLISLGHHEDAFSRGNKILPIIVQLKFLEII